MIEFLKFLKSLIFAAVYYIYNNHIGKLRRYYADLAERIIRNQRGFIIWPISVAFIISYPSIYSFYNSSDYTFESSYSASLQANSFGGLGFQNASDLLLKQVWLNPDSNDFTGSQFEIKAGALDKEFLIKALKLQNILLDSVPFSSTSNDIFIHTPFSLWNNDLDTLIDDNNIIKTINQRSIKDFSGSVVSSSTLFSGVVKINGLIKSADSIRIIMLYKSEASYGKLWDQNLSEIRNSDGAIEDFRITQHATDSQSFSLKLTKLTKLDHLMLTICYTLISIYFTLSLVNLKSVRSKTGLVVAFSTQTMLSIMSSATLTTYFFEAVNFYQIPIQTLPFIVIVVGMENMFRLVTSISLTADELAIPYRLSKALSDCGLTSTSTVLMDLIILRLVFPHVGQNTQNFCIFASLALIIDHILHFTFFASILSIDLHRLELLDLIGHDERSWLDVLRSKRQSFVDSYDENPSANLTIWCHRTKGLLSKVQFPLSTNVFGTAVVTLFLVGTNIRWSNETSNPINTASEALDDLANFLDKVGISNEIVRIVGNSKTGLSNISLIAEVPAIAYLGTLDPPFVFNNKITYKFDIFYVLEFLALLTFILSIALIVFRYFTSPFTVDDYSKSNLNKILEKEHSFQVKVLSGGHFLDIIKTTTSNSPFIVSVGLDHKVLVWSPISQPMPTPSQLPIGPHLWPITHAVLSDHGNFVAIFSKSGIVQCWSRLSMSWIWKFEHEDLKNSFPLEAFFRHKTIPAFLQRRRANDLLKQSLSKPSSRRNSMRSIGSPKVMATLAFSNNIGVTNELEELVIVSKSGLILTASCEDGSLRSEKLSTSSIVSSVKLISPRINDRLISSTPDGKILVSTAVNNKWKTRTITVDQYKFNNPINLHSTQASSNLRYERANISTIQEVNEESSSTSSLEPKPDSFYDKCVIAIVPFVGFMVRASDHFAELIDVQTGILIKKFSIRSFKRGSFKVFHNQPTHCRFCGSVSIESFSVAYTLAGTNTVVMHSFKADHRAKTSICLRVERDPREIRCVGFNSVAEYQHELQNVEGWCATDKNEIVGIKRKSEEQILESIDELKKSTIRRRHSGRHFNDESAPRIYDLWQGWTMNADGKVEFYDIPDTGNADGLLVNSVGQINRFGHKSIVVVFGNIMKILYLGNDDLVYLEDNQPANEEISGLTFVNKRRRNLKKGDKAQSTTFNDVDAIPGLSELAL